MSRDRLLPLAEREARFAVEKAEVLGLDEIKTGILHPLEQVDDLLVRDLAVVVVRHKAATPVVNTESVLETLRIDLRPTVRDHHELKAIAVSGGFELLAEFIACTVVAAVPPMEENVNADEFFFRRLKDGVYRLAVGFGDRKCPRGGAGGRLRRSLRLFCIRQA